MNKPNRFTQDLGGELMVCSYCSRRTGMLTCEEYPKRIPAKVMSPYEKDMPCFKAKREEK